MQTIISILMSSILGLSLTAHAQGEWPAKPVKIIVGSTAGGGTDVVARLLSQAMSDSTGQPFVVDNRPGASGTIGAQATAAAPADGYTILVSANASIAINPWLLKSPGFDVVKDLTPVSRGVMGLAVLVVNPTVKANSLSEFVALAKQKPDSLTFGSAGVGTPLYLGVRMMEEIGGLKFVHVPYKGNAFAYQDMMGGVLQFMYTDLATALPLISSGKLRALAVSQKTELLPNTATFAEGGWATFEAPISFSVLAPAKTPRPVITRIATEVAKAMKTISPQLEKRGLLPVYDTPAEFAKNLDRERAQWGTVVKRNKITVED